MLSFVVGQFAGFEPITCSDAKENYQTSQCCADDSLTTTLGPTVPSVYMSLTGANVDQTENSRFFKASDTSYASSIHKNLQSHRRSTPEDLDSLSYMPTPTYARVSQQHVTQNANFDKWIDSYASLEKPSNRYDLLNLNVLQLQALMRNGKLTAVELLTAAQEQHAHASVLNYVDTVVDERALAAASTADRASA